MHPFRIGPWLVIAAMICFALAAFLLVYRLIAALIVAGILGLAGCTLVGLGTTLWRAEAEARRRMGGPGPRPGPEEIKDAEGTWRDGDRR